MALVDGDLLGETFGVRAFHRCQVLNLLKRQLIPVELTTMDEELPAPTLASDLLTYFFSDETVPWWGEVSPSSEVSDAFLKEW